ncbi:zinc-binding oxidoreductase CipB [Aspergillus crustosus]
MSSNSAAWLTSPKTRPLEVKSAPLWTATTNEILIKNHAIAINPMLQGEVIKGGPNATRFKPGDRVVGHALGMATKRLQIPDDIAFEIAAVLPLGLSTAACGLFQKDYLDLGYPTEPRAGDTGKVVLVWGGASSVGSNAIQLAVAAGYEVLTTASLKNFGYVKNLGAVAVFDYNSRTAVEDLVTALKGKRLAGALDYVVFQSEGEKVVATTKAGFQAAEGVTVKMIFGTRKAIYGDFLPKALQAKSFIPVPQPLVAGKGLERVQGAVDLLAKGVSARKVVVTL